MSPGTLLQINNQGVLLQGKAGIGKSNLALALLERGHRLVIDDAPLFKLDKQARLIGYGEPYQCGFLHIREAGIINVQDIWGKNAIILSTPIHWIVRLCDNLDKEAAQTLEPIIDSGTIMNIDIPRLHISTQPDYTLALRLEVLLHSQSSKESPLITFKSGQAIL